MNLDRRTFVRAAGLVTVAATVGVSATSCAAAPVIKTNWLIQLGRDLGISIIAGAASAKVNDYWDKWIEGKEKARSDFKDQGWMYNSEVIYGDAVPPAIFYGVFKEKKSDPSSDLLVFVVDGGDKYVAFNPWAWQALYLFVQELTDGKKGDTLAGFRALCMISLIPCTHLNSTTSLTGNSTLLEYRTRNGIVEMVRTTTEDGETMVEVRATGIPNESGGHAVRQFTLPSTFED